MEKSSLQSQVNRQPWDSYPQKNTLALLVKLMRPSQWIKSMFVFVGLIFSDNWGNMLFLTHALTAAAGFSLVSSSVYVLNDLSDIENDRHHPVKKHRPLASGRVTVPAAWSVFLFCLVTGLLLGYQASGAVLILLIIYILQNFAYSRLLKHVVILDVFLIALGFMLRILAGTWGIGIRPSNWLLLCGLMITLFIGFGKRWAELKELVENASDHRTVLGNYSLAFLDKIMGITACGVIITYSLYTVDSTTVTRHGTDALIYTVPFVIYGVFRYLYLIYNQHEGGDPSRLVLKDPHIMIVVLLWLISVLLLLRR